MTQTTIIIDEAMMGTEWGAGDSLHEFARALEAELGEGYRVTVASSYNGAPALPEWVTDEVWNRALDSLQ